MLMHDVGMVVVRAAQPPVKTGKTRDTLRAGKGKTKAVVRAGGARAPYVGVTHYGTPGGEILPNPWLLEALQDTRPQVLSTLEAGIDQILVKNHLK